MRVKQIRFILLQLESLLLRRIFQILILFTLLSYFLNGSLFVEKIVKKINSIAPFKCSFLSKVFDGEEIVSEENGNIFYSDKNHIKWTYYEPEFKVWLMNNNNYEFYEKDENQITKGIIKEREKIWLWKIFNISNSSEGVKINKVNRIIIYKDEESGSDYKIHFDNNNLPVKLIQIDPTGVRIEYSFMKYIFNLKTDKELFTIKIPKGTDIVELN